MYYYKVYFTDESFLLATKKVTDYYDIIKLPKPKNKFFAGKLYKDVKLVYTSDKRYIISPTNKITITKKSKYYLKRIFKNDLFIEII